MCVTRKMLASSKKIDLNTKRKDKEMNTHNNKKDDIPEKLSVSSKGQCINNRFAIAMTSIFSLNSLCKYAFAPNGGKKGLNKNDQQVLQVNK